MKNSQVMQSNCLKVSGEGTISISPNQAEITLGANTEDKSLQKAQQENSRILSNVIVTLEQLGIPKRNIQTVIYRIETLYDYQDGRRIFQGYRVNHQLQITINQIELTGQVVDQAVSQGANIVSNIEFTVTNKDNYYNEALKIALHNAYTKAVSLTSQLPVSLNSIPLKIEELSNVTPPPVPYTTTMALKAEATPIQPGEITISATIIAHYFYC